jgi:hypothetical protein
MKILQTWLLILYLIQLVIVLIGLCNQATFEKKREFLLNLIPFFYLGKTFKYLKKCYLKLE